MLPSSKVPTLKAGSPATAAVQIARLADSVQPPPPLQAGQWSDYQMHGVLFADVTDVGKTPTPDAKASIPISLEVWSNSTGTTCTSEQFGTATFASMQDAGAWHSIGLIDNPTNQPVTDCAAGLQASDGSTLDALDISSLTHDPATLATELQEGATGISSLDGMAPGESPAMAGLVRLTALLVGPISGGWSGFGQEILKTMALLPGVISLGPTTSESGLDGLAFSAGPAPPAGATSSAPTSPTVVLDPATGALLEARNFPIPVLQAAAQDFVGTPSAPVFTQGVGYGISTTWIDPVAPPSVIAQSALPPWINTFHVVEAVSKPTTTEQEVSNVVDPFLGNGNLSFSENGVPGAGQITFDITIRGTAADEDAFVGALTASGLFESISVKA